MQQQEAERLASLVLFGDPDWHQCIPLAIGYDCDYALNIHGERISFAALVEQIKSGERDSQGRVEP